jgi:hypothetical protein
MAARISAAWAVLRGGPTCGHRDAQPRSVHHLYTVAANGAPVPTTLVLLVCDRCTGVHVEQLAGFWTLDQLTVRIPAAEVVRRELDEEGDRPCTTNP